MEHRCGIFVSGWIPFSINFPFKSTDQLSSPEALNSGGNLGASDPCEAARMKVLFPGKIASWQRHNNQLNKLTLIAFNLISERAN